MTDPANILLNQIKRDTTTPAPVLLQKAQQDLARAEIVNLVFSI
jgi:hypothetical protein